MNRISKREEEILVRVAWEYYVQEQSQADIAARWGLSRPTISRLIKRARQSGIVKISIHSPYGLCIELEEKLVNVYGLKRATVIPAANDEHDVENALSEAAGTYLNQLVNSIRSLAVGWGRTISQVARYAQRPDSAPSVQHGLELVVEMVGNFLSSGDSMHSLRPAVQLAQAYGADVSVLSAPAVTADASTCEQFKAHPQIRDVLAAAAKADIAIAGIGPAHPSSTLLSTGMLSAADIAALRERGAIGEILGRFFTSSGDVVRTPLDHRLIGLDLSDLKSIPHMMVLAAGPLKYEAIRGALRTDVIDHLVTDETTAQWLLDDRQQ